ncbi:AAA family ATPase [Ruminococcus albus]|uniref:AAA family ATPase n=1 Tax=Ruminococcus albus TaxID=1264 RepID=UPI001A9A5E45|nr:AAA family ATPase [Ruminococcus albus]
MKIVSYAKILIADNDEKYIIALERLFIDGYDRHCSLTAITDMEYIERLFTSPQSFDIMIINEQMFDPQFVKHEIDNIFVLAESNENIGHKPEMNISMIYKYSSAKEIYNAVVSNLSPESAASTRRKSAEIISIYSPSGGSGKTVLSFGLAAALSKKYKKVLYIGMDLLQSFGSFMKNPVFIQSGFETPLKSKSEYIVDVAEPVIVNELFSILPPFSKSLTSMDIGCSEYLYLAEKLKESGNYDNIIIDCDSSFVRDTSKIMSVSDKVIILTDQSRSGFYKLERLLNNIDCSEESKFTFVCGKYRKEYDLANEINFSFIIPYIESADEIGYEKLSDINEIESLAMKFI